MMKTPSFLPALLLGAALGAVPCAHAARALDARLANPDVARRYFGTVQGVAVWMSNMRAGQVVSRALLRQGGGGFWLNLPSELPVQTTRYEVCAGPKLTPPHVMTYTPETLMLYSRKLNKALGPLIQADDPKNPTRTTTYVYSAQPATIQGKCTYLNQRYNLTLNKGWNAVTLSTRLTRDGNTTFIEQATENLPFWIKDDLKLDQVDRLLPASFFKGL